MNSGEIASIIVALLMGTGLWETVRRVLDARAKRQDLRARQPEAIQDSSVDRAQKALLVMEGALDAAVQRAEAAEARVAELETQIDHLEVALETLRQQLNDAKTQLDQASAQLAVLRDALPPRSETQQ